MDKKLCIKFCLSFCSYLTNFILLPIVKCHAILPILCKIFTEVLLLLTLLEIYIRRALFLLTVPYSISKGVIFKNIIHDIFHVESHTQEQHINLYNIYCNLMCRLCTLPMTLTININIILLNIIFLI